MQRLILEMHDTDGCTYDSIETYPVYGETPDQFLKDFQDRIWRLGPEDSLEFCGMRLYLGDFDFVVGPTARRSIYGVYTVDQWFEKYAD